MRCLPVVLLTVAATACSGNSAVVVSSVRHAPSPPATTSPEPIGPGGLFRKVGVWFIRNGKLFKVTRAIPFRQSLPADALHALLAGPTAGEEANGVTSAVPPDTRLLGVTHHAGVATVDMSAELGQGTSVVSARLLLAQIVYTAAQAPPIRAVRLELDNVPVSALPGSGLLVAPRLTRTRYRALVPSVEIAQPSMGATVFSPLHVAGYGRPGSTIHVSVVDAAGHILGRRNVPVAGASRDPFQGSFEADVTVALPSEAGDGTVIATDSAGGSARIPVQVGVPPVDVYWPGAGSLRQFDPLTLWIYDNRPDPGPVEVIVRGGNGATAGHAVVLPYSCHTRPCRLPLHVVHVPFSLTGVQYGSIEVDTVGPPYYTLHLPHVRLAPGHLPSACPSPAASSTQTDPLTRAAREVSAAAGRYLPITQLVAQLRVRAPELGRIAPAPDQDVFLHSDSFPQIGVTWLGESPGGRGLKAAYACSDGGGGSLVAPYNRSRP
jgi:Sporulation and spore germination/Immunoglobulin-like domain of bacterial spore germination